MAVKKKSGGSDGTSKAAPRKRASAPRKQAAPAPNPAVEELQTVGADVVPTVEVTTARPESLLADWDLHLFNEGTHHKLWEKLGNHAVPGGVMFGVWAPNAKSVSVIGDFNDWNRDANPLRARGASGIWEGFVPDLPRG